jgi:tetratricopeptide (TPR) repeat protein
MRPADNIDKLIKNLHLSTSAELDERIHSEISKVTAESKEIKSAKGELNVWRVIMKSRITKLASAAVIVLAIVFCTTFFDKSGTPAWGIEQTVEALEEVRTIIVSGTTVYDNGTKSLPFKCWIKLDHNNDNLFLRVESEREFAIVQGNTVYSRKPGTNRVKIMEGASIQNLQFWYKVMEFSPWLTSKMLKLLKSIANDWQETYGKDEKTGRDSVFVECSYKQLQASFWFIFDVESKLIVEAKHWMNTNRQGPPNAHVTTFVYNQEIPDEMFEFEIPKDAEVVYDKEIREREALRQKAWKLFEDKQYANALKIYQEADSIFMVGICYDNMGEHEKAIESFKEIINQEEDFQGSLSSTYFYLGNSYMQIGEKEKAIEAFENCLRSGQGFRDTEGFPIKNAREYIEKLKNHK